MYKRQSPRHTVSETDYRHLTLTFLGLLAIAVAAPRAGYAQKFVMGATSLKTAATPTFVAEGDFNGDGVPDFAVASSSTNTVSIILSLPNGTYAPKTDYTVTTPSHIVVADFNLDGKLDLAIAAGTDVYVMLGNGDGTFQPPMAQGFHASRLAVGDFNNDGAPDLAVASSSSGLYLGNGNGTFTAAGTTGLSYAYVAAADFNGDGNLDVLFGGGALMHAFLGDGAGGLTMAGAISAYPGENPLVADFNGDGKPDVAFTVTSCGSRTGCHTNLYTYLGVGDGTFTGASGTALPSAATALVLGDFNGDGKVDILAVPFGIMLGNGAGGFGAPTSVPLAFTPTGAVAGDFNNDGQLDIASLDKSGFLMIALSNHGTFPGTVTTVAADYGPNTVLTDLNGDGKLDLVTYCTTYPNYGIVVQLGNGDGTFQAPIFTPSVNMGGNIAVGDFNNDGIPDLAIDGPGSTTLTFAIYLGNGDGTFKAPIVTSSSTYAYTMVAADFNGDGKLDVAFSAQNGASLVVYLGNGDGTFGPPTNYTDTCFSFGTDLAVADFNQDGKPDVAMPCGALDIKLGNGDGTLGPAKGYGSGAASPMVVGDFNGDGKVDVATGQYIFLGNGDGTFAGASSPYTSTAAYNYLVSADFDNDGKSDLAFLMYPLGYNDPHVLLSNGDGTFNPFPVSGHPAGGLAAGDLNGDGAPDLVGTTPGTSSSELYVTLNVPVASFAPAQLNFPDEEVGLTSAPVTLTVSNPGASPVSVGTVTASGDFAVSSNGCTSPVLSGDSCAIQLTFTPSTLGARSGVLVVPSNNFGGTAAFALAGNGVAPGQAISISPSSTNYGNQLMGTTSAPRSFIITNSGSSVVNVSSVSTTGDFSQTNNCPAALNPSATCRAIVTFSPTATGARSGSLLITDDASGSPQSASLTGTGLAPVGTFSPASVDFGSVIVGNPSGVASVILTNTGTGNLLITSLATTGDYSQTNTCGTKLAPGASCYIYITFTPTTFGTRPGTLTVTDNNNGVNGSVQTVPLTGYGSNSDATISPASLSFGNQVVGSSSAAKVFTLTSTGDTNLIISSVTFAGGAYGEYTESNTCPSGLAPGSSCTISVRFAPTSAGTFSGTIDVFDNSENSPHTAAVSGTGIIGVTLSPTSLAFGNQAENTTSAAKTVTLTNNQSTALSISSITASPNFAQTNTCGSSVPAKGKCTITVTFTPPGLGAFSGTLTATDSASNSPQSITLTGTGVVPVTLTPGTLGFGNQAEMTTSSPKNVTLTNNMNASLTGVSVGVSGPYSETDTCGGTVAPHAKCTISVTFAPTGTGSAPGTLSVTDSASTSPQTVTLTGTGVVQAAATPSSLTFPMTTVGTTSAAKTVTLKNNLGITLTVSTIAASGDFAESNGCGGSLAPAATCAISVTFTPTAKGSRSGTLTITDSANNSPQTVSLIGTGK